MAYPRQWCFRGGQPIAPTWRKEPFDDPDWLFEFTYDGFRALCYLVVQHVQVNGGQAVIAGQARGRATGEAQ